MVELREADCCYNCEHIRCVRYSCWGVCPYCPHEDKTVMWHQICDEYDHREGELQFAED